MPKMTKGDAERYLTSLGAKIDPGSTSTKVYGWIARQKRWFMVKVTPDGYANVTFHSDCPCSI